MDKLKLYQIGKDDAARLLQRASLIILAIMVFALAGEAKKRLPVKNTRVSTDVSAPDFAYPKTVIAEAEKKMREASLSGNGALCVEAAVQIVIANGQISRESAPAMAQYLDSIAAGMPQPWQSVLYSLEAQVYENYYQDNSWQFNSRNVPLSPVPENPAEWSRDLFALKVTELVKRSLVSDQLKKIPSTDLKKILDDSSDDYPLYYPTAYDILAYRGENLLKTFAGSREIPFGIRSGKRSVSSQVEECRNSILQSLLSEARESINKAELAVALRQEANLLTSSGEARETLRKGIAELGDSEYTVLLWIALDGYYVDSPQTRREYYDSICAVINRYPDYPYINGLKNIAARMSAPEAHANGSANVLSGDSIEVKYNCSNVARVNLLLVKCSGLSVSSGFAKFSDIMASGKVVDSKVVEVDSIVPFQAERTVRFAPQTYGEYVVLASKTKGLDGVFRPARDTYTYSIIRVSDLSMLNSYSTKDKDSNRIYVVNGRNQKPVEGAKVKIEKLNGGAVKTTTLTTNSEGFVECGIGNISATATFGKDGVYSQFWSSQNSGSDNEILSATVLTDLSVYHPGDTVGFSVIAYKEHNREFSPLAERELFVIMRNENNVECGTLKATTDRYGRIAGSLRLPSDGLLGSYSVTVQDKEKYITTQYVEVAEYKAPTFFVEIGSIQGDIKIGDVVRIKGRAATYSGMPLADAEVNYKVNYEPLWWRAAVSGDCSYADSVTTDAAGEFIIELPTESLRSTPFAFGIYSISATITSAAGETQSAPARRFALGKSYSIHPAIPPTVNIDGSLKEFKVTVSDILGDETSRKVNYKILEGEAEKVAAEGDFISPGFPDVLSKLAPGLYTIKFTIDGYEEASAEQQVVIYSSMSNKPPYATTLWVPKREYYADPDSKTVKVTVGSGYKDAWILCELADTEKVIWRKWLNIDNANMQVEVPAPAKETRYWLNVRGMNDLAPSTDIIKILPSEAKEHLKIGVKSFRDKLVPGTEEIWTFSVAYADHPCAQAPVVAVLNNKALAAIAPFNWWLSPQASWSSALRTGNSWSGSSYFSFPMGNAKTYPVKSPYMPQINTYGYNLAGGFNLINIRGSFYRMNSKAATTEAGGVVEELAVAAPTYASANVMNDMKAKSDDLVVEEAVVVEEEDSDGGISSKSDVEPQLRPSELPLAFFKPSLTTDSDGNVEIRFKVPDFNTTWTFKLLSYDESMHSDILTLEAVASKPIMVSSNAPRFLRTGDRVMLNATVMNNTDSLRSVGGRLEVFDPYTDRILLSRDVEASGIGSKESRVISMEFDIPDSLQAVAFRAYAISENYTDGEQTLIGILPSSSPITEATPFYLDPDETARITLPEYPEDAQLTLRYCDNPVWYCVTALPDISTPESENLNALIYAFYGNAMTRGLLKRYPQIKEALDYWRTNPADSMLVSGLERNPELKALALSNTPWVNNAQSETLRMERLAALAQGASDNTVVNDLISRIAALQNLDGGWSWCKGMRSSVFMTEQVLVVSSMLAQAGCMPDNRSLSDMLLKGARFYEKEILKEYYRDKKNFSPEIVTDYLLAISYLGLHPDVAGFATIRNAALKSVREGWKTAPVASAARDALLLNRSGYQMEARSILESLRQRSMTKAGRGVWYDNMSSGFDGSWRIYATSSVLRAFSEIAPSDSQIINGLRQWLLTEREVEDWGSMRFTADAVQAILGSGADWTSASSPAEFSINGKPLSTPAKGYTGEFKLTLNAEEASGATLAINRSGGTPSWGSVTAQYILPMDDVKAASVPDLKIEKRILVVNESADGTELVEASPSVGDKVRVMLTVTSSRDLDYVAITDERGAFMEPAQQLSSYTSADGLWFYRETCNSATNFFMSFLPKGTHVIYYDCYASQSGEFAVGIALAQSYYAPSVVAHSAGAEISVSAK